MKILIVKDPWAGMIVNGSKDLEVRGADTKYRGPVLIAQSGTGTIIGSCYLAGSVAAFKASFNELKDRHRIGMPYESLPYRHPYYWQLCQAKRFDEPIPYRHPQGAVIWVKDPLNVTDPAYHGQLIKLEQEYKQK